MVFSLCYILSAVHVPSGRLTNIFMTDVQHMATMLVRAMAFCFRYNSFFFVSVPAHVFFDDAFEGSRGRRKANSYSRDFVSVLDTCVRCVPLLL